ncbi:MAG: MogA/MoaB family molybdenum cofactor biosynthesis protein [Bacteroidales bacterium]
MLPELYKILIITLSDRAYRGEYDDRSGPRMEVLFREFSRSQNWKCNIERIILPDNRDMLHGRLSKAVREYDIIFTTGGTGIGPRDITVETVRTLLTKEIPGIMEYIRVKYGDENPCALLSRSVAGVANKCLIYTFPGSVKAVEEYMTEILKTLPHAIEMIYSIDTHKKH